MFAAAAVVAHHDYFLVFWEFVRACGNLAHGNVSGAGDRCRSHFVMFAHVEQYELFAQRTPLRKFFYFDFAHVYVCFPVSIKSCMGLDAFA